MTISFQVFLFLTIALSMDSFTAGLTYGTGNVRVPFLSSVIIASISGFMLTLSFLAGGVLLSFIPVFFTKILSFLILFMLSLYKLYDALPSKRHTPLTTDSISEKVNKKNKHILSCGEAFILALALSVDNISAGISAGSPRLPYSVIFFITAGIHFLFIQSGIRLGCLISGKISCNFSLLGAALLFLLALLRLF